MNRRCILVMGVGLFTGCGDDETTSPATFDFTPESLGSGPALGIREGSFEGSSLRLVLAATGLADLFGFAIEIAHPAGLRFESFVPTELFPVGTDVVTRKLTETTLHLAVAPRRSPPTLSVADYDLGTLTFTRLEDPSGELQIYGARSEVFAQNGFPRRDVAYSGGRIERR